MMSYLNEENQLILKKLKVEIAALKNGQKPKQKTVYPEYIVKQLMSLISNGAPYSFISKATGVATTTLFTWQNKSKIKKTKKTKKKFTQLKIVEVAKVTPAKTEEKIRILLGGGIQLSIPLNLMGPMLKVLKEEWYASRI